MDFPHMNQYAGPEFSVEQWGQREEGAERQMRRREGGGMSCVEKEILIGGKEKEQERSYVRFEEKNWEKRETTRILHAEAILVELVYFGLQVSLLLR